MNASAEMIKNDLLNSEEIATTQESKRKVIFNAENVAKKWKLPSIKKTKKWKLILDSSSSLDENVKLGSSKQIMIPAWSVVVVKIDI